MFSYYDYLILPPHFLDFSDQCVGLLHVDLLRDQYQGIDWGMGEVLEQTKHSEWTHFLKDMSRYIYRQCSLVLRWGVSMVSAL